MTSPEAAACYRYQHNREYAGRPLAVYNPHNKPVDELPIIYGFNNGGSPGWWTGYLLAEDGTCLGGHICSHEDYMPADLGVLEGTRPERHKDQFQPHYPDGYRMLFIPLFRVPTHPGLEAAIQRNLAQRPTPEAVT